MRDDDDAGEWRWPRFTTRAALGIHGATAAAIEVVLQAPLVAGLIGAMVALAALQIGVLAACTRGLRVGA